MPTAERMPLFGALALARQCVVTVDALTRDLPAEVGQPLRDGARRDLAAAEAMAVDWLPAEAVAGMVGEAERIRSEAIAATAAQARPGETPYQTQARLAGRGED